MNKNDSITIIKIANGWLIKPPPDFSRDSTSNIHDMYSFNFLEVDAAGVQSDKCVFGWLTNHFADENAVVIDNVREKAHISA